MGNTTSRSAWTRRRRGRRAGRTSSSSTLCPSASSRRRCTGRSTTTSSSPAAPTSPSEPGAGGPSGPPVLDHQLQRRGTLILVHVEAVDRVDGGGQGVGRAEADRPAGAGGQGGREAQVLFPHAALRLDAKSAREARPGGSLGPTPHR